jgi:hypothetical protein
VKLALELDSETAAPGGRVAGRANVLEGGESRSLELTVSFHEQSRDYGATPLSTELVLHQGDLTAGQTLEFSFDLPADALPSVKAEHSELYWELALRSDEPGFDTVASRRLEVV